jgi:hypothetical protein
MLCQGVIDIEVTPSVQAYEPDKPLEYNTEPEDTCHMDEVAYCCYCNKPLFHKDGKHVTPTGHIICSPCMEEKLR